MTQEERQLLLKDLCARLLYGIIAYASEINKNGIITDVNIPYNMVNLTVDNASGKYELVPLFDIKPYLRPMSSMTEEEHEELLDKVQKDWSIDIDKLGDLYFDIGDACYPDIDLFLDIIDWLNKNHFDYRGLIKKGLAIAVTEENNPYKE